MIIFKAYSGWWQILFKILKEEYNINKNECIVTLGEGNRYWVMELKDKKIEVLLHLRFDADRLLEDCPDE